MCLDAAHISKSRIPPWLVSVRFSVLQDAARGSKRLVTTSGLGSEDGGDNGRAVQDVINRFVLEKKTLFE